MKILKIKEGSRAINQKCNSFTADVITYGALTLESICEEYGSVPKINKTGFLEDIVSSTYHKKNLEYGFLGKKIDVKEACDLALAVKHFVTYETFYFDFRINEEIKSIKTFFMNKEEIKNNYFSNHDKLNHAKNKDKYGIEEYQVSALIGLENSLDDIKNNALNNGDIICDESIGFWDEYEEIILKYYCDLVMGSINNSKYYPKNPIHNDYLNIIKDFYNKDSRTLYRLIINIIKHVYIEKEIKQENDLYYSDKNFNVLQEFVLDEIAWYIKS